MLGPALTQLLYTLDSIPERSSVQEQLFLELQELFAAVPRRDHEVFVTAYKRIGRHELPAGFSAVQYQQNAALWKLYGGVTTPFEPSPGQRSPSTGPSPYDPLSLTEPISTGACNKCGQYFPVYTQPKP